MIETGINLEKIEGTYVIASIRVGDYEESATIQDKLFGAGWKWAGENNKKKLRFTNTYFQAWTDKRISYGGNIKDRLMGQRIYEFNELNDFIRYIRGEKDIQPTEPIGIDEKATEELHRWCKERMKK